VITSRDNPKLRTIARLQARRDRACFVAEGEDLVDAAAAAGWPARFVLRAGEDVEPRLLDDVSALGSGTRVVGVYDRRLLDAPAGPRCVALWGVHDPGNVGTVLRSALAFGAACVALGPETADPFAPKAVRASMGAVFRVPVARAARVADLPGRTVALSSRGGDALSDVPLGEPLTLLVGGERAGLPPEALAAADAVAHIPIAADSLNAAMAATVALYELDRRIRRP
jgi:RNA methyltransferase, TrmH family